MSHECTHDESRLGNFVVHDNGSTWWGPPAQEKTQRVSWIEIGDREFSFPITMSNAEADQGRKLAAKIDKNMAKGVPFADLTNGEFVAAANGDVLWGEAEPPKTHMMSWIDDDNKRIYSELLESLCLPEEVNQCQQLAAQYDKKAVK
jgi:hypothetical protein